MLRRTVLAGAVRLIAGASALARSAVARRIRPPLSIISVTNSRWSTQSPPRTGTRPISRTVPRGLRHNRPRPLCCWPILVGFHPLERQQFLGLFEDYVVVIYSDRLSEYAGNGGPLRVTGGPPRPDRGARLQQDHSGFRDVDRHSRGHPAADRKRRHSINGSRCPFAARYPSPFHRTGNALRRYRNQRFVGRTAPQRLKP